MTPDRFLTESGRIAHQLCRSALRHGGRATWLADEYVARGQGLARTARTLRSDLAGGTAGVGWFLARLAAVTGDQDTGAVATEAVRHALDGGHDLVEVGKLGWYDGALGVSWAAIDGGMALDDATLIDAGLEVGGAALAACGASPSVSGHRGLVGGEAGVVAGILAVESVSVGSSDASGPRAAALAAQGPLFDPAQPEHWLGRQAPSGGMAMGETGVALVLAAWSAASGDGEAHEAAIRQSVADRAWFEPGTGWLTMPAHDWMEMSVATDRSWCAGAAGMGAARIGLYSALGDVADLADAAAAIELARADLIVDDGSDASLCHGAAGAIDLLISAGAVLDEPQHIAAARSAGATLLERVRGHGRYGTALGPGTQNASLLYGLAGTGLLFLRLSDSGGTPTPTLPPFLVAAANADQQAD